jgi:regulator of cell morphogenesis and NO signaling
MNSLLSRTVGQLVVERPARAKVFESLGIDFCCGGRKPLQQACTEIGLDMAMVERVLNTFDAEAQSAAVETDWSKATLTELAAHIEGTHHAYLKRDLPQLGAWVAKVGSRHGDRDSRLVTLASVFAAFTEELTQHMMKEERVLFPLIREMEAGNTKAAASHCGSVQNPIRVMIAEHDHAGDALEQMAELTDNFYAAPDACNTFRAMMDGLAHLRRDMHQHVHKENNILFPRAIELESSLVA